MAPTTHAEDAPATPSQLSLATGIAFAAVPMMRS